MPGACEVVAGQQAPRKENDCMGRATAVRRHIVEAADRPFMSAVSGRHPTAIAKVASARPFLLSFQDEE